MSDAQMHGKSHRPIANKCANLEQYERWAKQYIDGDLAATEKGMKVKVVIDTAPAKNYAVSNGMRQIARLAVEAEQKLFYSHLISAVQTFKPPGKKAKATTVAHAYWFDVTGAINPKRRAAIDKAHKIQRMKPVEPEKEE